MRKWAILAAILFSSLLLRFSGLVSWGKDLRTVTEWRGFAMTMPYHIKVGNALSSSKEEDVSTSIRATFDEVHSVFNQWNPDSEAAQINGLAAHQRYRLSPEMAAFIELTDGLVALTEGRFDPTIGPVKELWLRQLEQRKIPTTHELTKLQAVVGWKNIHVVGDVLWKEHSETTVNFDSIAKGYAVDMLVERLQKLGIKDLYVEWGGEIHAIGQHPDRRPWRVAIRGIDSDDISESLAYVSLNDSAIATSGDYLQHWELECDDGAVLSFTHLVDPSTGRLLERREGAIASASIVTDGCAVADALATAACVFGDVDSVKKWFLKVRERYPDAKLYLSERH